MRTSQWLDQGLTSGNPSERKPRRPPTPGGAPRYAAHRGSGRPGGRNCTPWSDNVGGSQLFCDKEKPAV
jgi:hypothetical protein